MNTLGFYPVFNPPVPEAVCASRGEAIAQAFNALDDLAEDNGLDPLTVFVDNREIGIDFDETTENLDVLTTPWEDWYACDEGIEVFSGIARLLREGSKSHPSIPNAAALAQELEDWVAVLNVAQTKGSKFRLEWGES